MYVRDSNRASLPKVEYNRGRRINMSQLTAIDSREKKDEKKTGPLTIAFETVRGKSKASRVGSFVLLTGAQIEKNLQLHWKEQSLLEQLLETLSTS